MTFSYVWKKLPSLHQAAPVYLLRKIQSGLLKISAQAGEEHYLPNTFSEKVSVLYSFTVRAQFSHSLEESTWRSIFSRIINTYRVFESAEIAKDGIICDKFTSAIKDYRKYRDQLLMVEYVSL